MTENRRVIYTMKAYVTSGRGEGVGRSSGALEVKGLAHGEWPRIEEMSGPARRRRSHPGNSERTTP
jgi:hypothetical protein